MMTALATVWRYRWWILTGVLLVGLGWQRMTILDLRREAAERAAQVAIDANAAQTKAIHDMQRDALADRAAEKVAIEREKALTDETEKLKRDLRHAPQADDAAGLYFDDLADRLRVLDAGRDQDGGGS